MVLQIKFSAMLLRSPPPPSYVSSWLCSYFQCAVSWLFNTHNLQCEVCNCRAPAIARKHACIIDNVTTLCIWMLCRHLQLLSAMASTGRCTRITSTSHNKTTTTTKNRMKKANVVVCVWLTFARTWTRDARQAKDRVGFLVKIVKCTRKPCSVCDGKVMMKMIDRHCACHRPNAMQRDAVQTSPRMVFASLFGEFTVHNESMQLNG